MPDPHRLLEVYNASAATLNLCRAFATGGYADLRQVHAWNTDFVQELAGRRRYEKLAADIDRALSFMRAIGAESGRVPPGRLPLQPRGADPGVRARADPDRLAHRAPVRRLRALPLDRGADPAARRRPRGAAVADPQPDRRQARSDDDAGRCGGARRASSTRRTSPAG